MASEITTSLMKTQMTGRIDSAKRVTPAQGEGTNLVDTAKNADKQPSTKVEQKDTQKQEATVSDKVELEHAVADINQFVQNMQRELQFTVEDSSENTVILVRDTETNEVIRQIPSEDALKLAQALHDAQDKSSGYIFEGRA